MVEIGKILMTVAILQFTIIPLFADLNRSHAANPDWPGHARLHVVTHVLTTSSLGVLALYFLWSGRVQSDLGVCFAMLCSVGALLPFFASVISSPLFGGQIVPARHGVARVRFGWIEGNLANFGSAAILLVAGRLLLL